MCLSKHANSFPKFKRPPCETHLLRINQLYTTPSRNVHNCLGSLRWNKLNTKGTSVWSCFCAEELDDSFPGGRTLHLITLPPCLSRGSLHPRIHSGDRREIGIFKNGGVENYVHIVNLLPFLDSVMFWLIRFYPRARRPENLLQSSSHRARAKFIFMTIFAQCKIPQYRSGTIYSRDLMPSLTAL